MREVVLSALARRDLKDIWRFSHGEWGEGQADRYFRELNDGIDALGAYPERGVVRDNVRSGYRSIQVRRHVVFYTLTDQYVRIVRVLHDAMDEARHL